jgi:NAD(P)-dependent dehydrogenase (short-subunit alcohol dehydrogenase family)
MLDSKVAVITGSTRGLGLAIAQVYAREDAAVVVSSRFAEAVQRVVTDLRQQGRRAAGLPSDVSDLEQVKALALFARETFGAIDIWVNNAGIADVFGPTTAIDPARYTQALQTNIFGTYYGSLVALGMFLAQGASGKLINILGRGDRGMVPYQSAYGSSKSWVRSFTLTLAKEYAHTDLGIFAFNPGLMDTDLQRKIEVIQRYAEKLSGFGTIIRM